MTEKFNWTQLHMRGHEKGEKERSRKVSKKISDCAMCTEKIHLRVHMFLQPMNQKSNGLQTFSQKIYPRRTEYLQKTL